MTAVRSFTSLRTTIRSRRAVVGITGSNCRDVISTCIDIASAGYACLIFGDDLTAGFEAASRRNAVLRAITPGENWANISLCDVVIVCGSYCGLGGADARKYRNVLRSVGRRLRSGCSELIILKGEFEPKSLQALHSELTLGGVLKAEYDVITAYARPADSYCRNWLIAGDTRVAASQAMYVLSQLLPTHDIATAGVVGPEVLEVVSAALLARTMADNAILTEMRGLLDSAGYNTTDVFNTLGFPAGVGTLSASTSGQIPGLRGYNAVKRLADIAKDHGVDAPTLRGCLKLEKHRPNKIVDRLQDELQARGVELAGAEVVVVVDLDAEAQSSHGFEDLPVWKLLNSRGVGLTYYNVRSGVTPSLRHGGCRVKDIKDGRYDAVIDLAAIPRTCHRSIARASGLVLDCCGNCRSDISGVLQV